jgi:hypothetical protein|tara:strand:- start:2140 stop:2469 length:330 start_codon:yes stop_codon:yes gene_type:complete
MIATLIAREQITVSNSALGLDAGATRINGSTAAIARNKQRFRYADIQVQGYQVRATFDGSTAPVAATTGELWSPSSKYRVWGLETALNLQLIREIASDATVVVTYWGER